MRAVFGLVLILGLGLAGFAVHMAQGYFEQQQVALEQERANAARIVPTVEVVAAARTLKYGERITAEDVQTVRYVQEAMPEGVFLTVEELFSKGPEELRAVLRQMEPNEPILAVKVTAPGEEAGITSRLGAGMRAFAIRVDATSGVSGFLRPGDLVDVYWTGRAGSEGGEFTQLIDTAMQIIAVDQSANSDRSEASVARTVTVEATPIQVASLAQAQSTGRLSLALVGADAGENVQSISVNQRSLLGIQEQVSIEAPQEEVCTIKTRRGAEVIEIPIPCS